MTDRAALLHPFEDPMGQAVAQLETSGFARLGAREWRELLGRTSGGLRTFAESWDRLDPDDWMGDGGTYRRRRFAAFTVGDGGAVRKPHQPHYQSRQHNRLNGGIDRWFSPVEPDIAGHPVTHALLDLGGRLAGRLSVVPDPGWHAEMHQFRIVAQAAQRVSPTPEGLHRDGVTAVLMMLIGRDNVAGGVTTLRDSQGRRVAEMELTAPYETLVLDDRHLLHEVSPIRAAAPGLYAIRDMLVLTFRPAPAAVTGCSVSIA